MNRDKTIDRLRGFAMIWVIVVHVLYWGNFFTNGYVNLLKSGAIFSDSKIIDQKTCVNKGVFDNRFEKI